MMLHFLILSSGRRFGVPSFLVLCAFVAAFQPSASHAQAATFQGLGFLPITDPGSFSSALGVSSDGTTAVGQSSSSVSGNQAFRWVNGARSGLGFVLGYTRDSAARSTNSDGTVVVGDSTSTSGSSQA